MRRRRPAIDRQAATWSATGSGITTETVVQTGAVAATVSEAAAGAAAVAAGTHMEAVVEATDGPPTAAGKSAADRTKHTAAARHEAVPGAATAAVAAPRTTMGPVAGTARGVTSGGTALAAMRGGAGLGTATTVLTPEQGAAAMAPDAAKTRTAAAEVRESDQSRQMAHRTMHGQTWPYDPARELESLLGACATFP